MLAELQQRIADGETPLSLISEIVTAVVARRGEHGHHAAWGLLCEQAGLLSLAFTEFQLALRDDRHDEVAAPRLAVHYRERGDFERATKLLEMLLARDAMRTDWLEPYCELLAEDGALPRIDAAIQRAEKWGLSPDAAARLRAAWLPARKKPATGPDAHEPASAAFAPTDADCIRMHTLFAGQEGVYARQWAKPGGKSPMVAGVICCRKKTVWKSWFGAKTNDGEIHSLSLRERAGVRARGVAKPDYSSTRNRPRKKSGRLVTDFVCLRQTRFEHRRHARRRPKRRF